jgi:hypothetical protein
MVTGVQTCALPIWIGNHNQHWDTESFELLQRCHGRIEIARATNVFIPIVYQPFAPPASIENNLSDLVVRSSRDSRILTVPYDSDIRSGLIATDQISFNSTSFASDLGISIPRHWVHEQSGMPPTEDGEIDG